MSTLADRIREAADALTGDIDEHTIPPLRRPEDMPRPSLAFRAPGRTRWPRYAAPLAAATALAAVAVAAGLIRTTAPDAPYGTVRHHPPAVLGGVPPYYVALYAPASGGRPRPLAAMIRATVTGRTLATVRPPASLSFIAVGGAGDDQTFALAARPAGTTAGGPLRFFELRYNPASRSAVTTSLAIPPLAGHQVLTGFALSGDGRDLAVSYHLAGGLSSVQTVRVYDLATGAMRSWSSPGWTGFPGYPRALSWARGHEVLAVDWSGPDDCGATSGATSSVRLLNLATGGGSLLADSTLAVAASAGGSGCFAGDPSISGNGRTVVAPIGAIDRRSHLGYVKLAEFSVRTHRLTGTLRPRYGLPGGWVAFVLWTGLAGRAVIVHATTGPGLSLLPYILPAAIAGDRSARLPWSIGTADAAW